MDTGGFQTNADVMLLLPWLYWFVTEARDTWCHMTQHLCVHSAHSCRISRISLFVDHLGKFICAPPR